MFDVGLGSRFESFEICERVFNEDIFSAGHAGHANVHRLEVDRVAA